MSTSLGYAWVSGLSTCFHSLSSPPHEDVEGEPRAPLDLEPQGRARAALGVARLAREAVRHVSPVAYGVYVRNACFTPQQEKGNVAVRLADLPRFQVDDELLSACMASRKTLSSGTTLHGFQSSKSTIGYALLAHAVRHALGIHRLPFHEDRILATRPTDEMKQELAGWRPLLTPKRLARLTAAVRRLYEHTQAQLAGMGWTQVRLRRRIHNAGGTWHSERTNQAYLLATYHQAATVLRLPTVALEMDLLNSFGDDGGYSHFPVCLELNVAAKDIVYCAHLVASRDGRYGSDLESGEWVVVNRSPDGVVNVPLEAIRVDPNSAERVERVKAMSREQAQDWITAHTSPYVQTAWHPPCLSLLPAASFRLGWKARLEHAWRGLRGRPCWI